MTFTPRDVKDVSALVAKKLEFYLNQERREDRFDTQGRFRTNPKMRTLDLMYQMLDSTEINKKSNRKKHRSSSSKRRESKKIEEEEGEAHNESEHEERQKKDKKERSRDKQKKKKIAPIVINNSLRVVPQNEAERLTDIANKVFEEQDFDKLHVIHRYRPNSRDIAPLTENGKVANYTLHVGSALHSTNYVNYYVKEVLVYMSLEDSDKAASGLHGKANTAIGLHSSKKESAKRFQRLQTKNKEDNAKSNHENDTCPDERKGQSSPCSDDDNEQPIFNPLIDQSTESLLSTSSVSGNLTPLDKDKPAYCTVFTSTRPSSRGSSDRQSKASSQLNKARMFANGYGYRIVGDKNNGVGACDSANRIIESRADIASSEEYCKFAKNNSMDSGRTGDGVEAVTMSNMPPLSENDLDYNKFQSLQSSLLLSGLEGDDSRAKSFYNNSRPSSQRSARSQRSYHSGKSSSIYMEGSMSACTEESDLYDTEVGPDTARSTSYPISTPRRSKKRYKPIETLIRTKEVPRLGLTSDINDSNGSWNSWTAEEYVTAEEKAKMNTDARAIEDKKNTSHEREGDGVLGNSLDARAADRSLQKVWNDGDDAQGLPTNGVGNCERVEGEVTADNAKGVMTLPAPLQDEVAGTCPPLDTVANTDNELTQASQQNTARSQGQTDLNNPENEMEGSVKSEVLLSSRTNKTLIDFGPDIGRPSSRSRSCKSKKIRGNEKPEAERGEDKVESMELHRGQVPDVEQNKLLKVKIERGDDTPRTMAAKGRLTKSAKRRGMSNYYTMGDEERGLEKEYFEPVEKDIPEMYIKARNTDDEEDPETPASSRPTSASSCASGSTGASDFDHRKRPVEDVLDGGKASGSRLQSQIEKSLDGRGDDSVSIKSGSVVSSALSKRNTKERRSSGSDKGAVSAKRQERYDEQNIPIESKSADLSGGSRGSRSVHVKLGVGKGYCIEGEALNRGYDESISRKNGGTADTKCEDSFKIGAPKDGDNNRPSSRASQKSVESALGKKAPSRNVSNASVEMKPEGIISDTAKFEESNRKETSQLAAVKPDNTEDIARKVEHISPNVSVPSVQREEDIAQKVENRSPNGSAPNVRREVEEKQDSQSLNQNICEDGAQNTQKEENTQEHAISNIENKKDSPNSMMTQEIANISNHSEKGDQVILPEEEQHKKVEVNGQTSEIINKDKVQDVPESAEEKDDVMVADVAATDLRKPVEVECDLFDQDVVKEAVSGSVSMFNEDSDTVIDFRPSSASTAISVGREQSGEQKRRSIPKPAKIAEVTETDSNFGSARESYRSSKAVAEPDVLHPATKKKREIKDPGAILNIADVKLDQVPENGEITHPSIKKKPENKTEVVSSRSTSLPCEKLNDDIDIADLCDKDKKSQSVDHIPYTNEVDENKNKDNETSGKNDLKSDDKIKEHNEKGENVKEKSIEKMVEEHDTHITTGYTDKPSDKEIITDKGTVVNETNRITNTPTESQEKLITEKLKVEGIEAKLTIDEDVKAANIEVKSNTRSHSGNIVNVTDNTNQGNGLEQVKENGVPMIVEQSANKPKETGEENMNPERMGEQMNANKAPCAVDLMIDLALEGNLAKDNVVADIISNNLKLNNETPRTPRPSDNVAEKIPAMDQQLGHTCGTTKEDQLSEHPEMESKTKINNCEKVSESSEPKTSEVHKEMKENATAHGNVTGTITTEDQQLPPEPNATKPKPDALVVKPEKEVSKVNEIPLSGEAKPVNDMNINAVENGNAVQDEQLPNGNLITGANSDSKDTLSQPKDYVDTRTLTDQVGRESTTTGNEEADTKQISQTTRVHVDKTNPNVDAEKTKTIIDIKTDVVADKMKTDVDTDKMKTRVGAEEMKTDVDADKMKTDVDTNKIKTRVDAEAIKTDVDTDKTKTVNDTVKTKTVVDADKTKTVIDADKTKTVIDTDKTKTVVDADKTKTVVDADKTKTDVDTDTTKTVFDTDKTKTVVDADKTKTVVDEYKTKTVVDADKTTKTVVDADETKTVVDADKTKTVVDADITKTVVDADKTKTVVDADKTKTVDDADKTKTDVNIDTTKTDVNIDKSKTDLDTNKTKTDLDTETVKTEYDTDKKLNLKHVEKEVVPRSQKAEVKQDKELTKPSQVEVSKTEREKEKQLETGTPSLESKIGTDLKDVRDETKTVSELKRSENEKAIASSQEDNSSVKKEEITAATKFASDNDNKIIPKEVNEVVGPEGESVQQPTYPEAGSGTSHVSDYKVESGKGMIQQSNDVELGVENSNNQQPKYVDVEGSKHDVDAKGISNIEKEQENTQMKHSEGDTEKKEAIVKVSENEASGKLLSTNIADIERKKEDAMVNVLEKENGTPTKDIEIAQGNEKVPLEASEFETGKERVEVKSPVADGEAKSLCKTVGETGVEIEDNDATVGTKGTGELNIQNEEAEKKRVKKTEDKTELQALGSQPGTNDAEKDSPSNPVHTKTETPEDRSPAPENNYCPPPLDDKTTDGSVVGEGKTLENAIQNIPSAPAFAGVEVEKIIDGTS